MGGWGGRERDITLRSFRSPQTSNVYPYIQKWSFRYEFERDFARFAENAFRMQKRRSLATRPEQPPAEPVFSDVSLTAWRYPHDSYMEAIAGRVLLRVSKTGASRASPLGRF